MITADEAEFLPQSLVDKVSEVQHFLSGMGHTTMKDQDLLQSESWSFMVGKTFEVTRQTTVARFQDAYLGVVFNTASLANKPLPSHPSKHDKRRHSCNIEAAKRMGLTLMRCGRIGIPAVNAQKVWNMNKDVACAKMRDSAQYVSRVLPGGDVLQTRITDIAQDLTEMHATYIRVLNPTEMELFHKSYQYTLPGVSLECVVRSTSFKPASTFGHVGLSAITKGFGYEAGSMQFVLAWLEIELAAAHLRDIVLVFTALDMDGVLPAGYINALVRSIIRLRAVGTHHLRLQWHRRERNE